MMGAVPGFGSVHRRVLRPLRVRLTIAFASVVAIVLLVTGLIVYDQVRRDIDTRTDLELAEREQALVGFSRDRRSPTEILALSGESLAQIYSGAGRVLASSPALRDGRLLSPSAASRAPRTSVVLTNPRVPGTDDGARVRGFALSGGRVAAIAESRDDREASLHRLAAILAVTLPAALLIASITGYQVARAALAPVDRMRQQAAAISDSDTTERLPSPGTDDELDRLAATLNDLLARLGTALERERRIVADASHELRTPISVLRTRIDVALRGEQTPQRLASALAAAGDDVARLGALADDLLLLARADQGQLALRAEPLDVQDLLEEASGRHRPLLDGSGRALEVQNRIDGGAVILADPRRVGQVLDNLLSNARRYGLGTVELEADLDGTGRVGFTVRDHGDGFPPSFLPHAFDRFAQADPSHGGAGTGLGLAIVRAITRAGGGDARALNHAAGGAEITATFPLA